MKYFLFYVLCLLSNKKYDIRKISPEKLTSGKFLPISFPPENSHPEYSHPCFSTFFFFFSLLSSLSLIFLKRLFCISFCLLLRLKSRSARGASNNPAFMGSCRTISHMFYSLFYPVDVGNEDAGLV